MVTCLEKERGKMKVPAAANIYMFGNTETDSANVMENGYKNGE